MISLRSREGDPVSPVLLYDGGEHALLYRRPEQSVLLDFIHPDARPYLFACDKVLVSETKDYAVEREYDVPCRRVKSLPLDQKAVRPLLSEEEAKQIDERNLYK